MTRSLAGTTPLGIVLLAAALAAGPAEGAKAPRDESPVDNLGDGLLDGLLDTLPGEPAPVEGDWLVDPAAIDREGREARGEDVGERGESPLEPVLSGMREAARRIGAAGGDAEGGEAVPVQRQVVSDLEKLIAAMEKQCSGGQCDKPSESDQRQASRRSKPKPGAAGATPAGQAARANRSPARQSSTRQGSAPVVDGDLAPPGELMKAAWGHLPERLRERMLQSSSEEFLPEYRDELEAYYRRLAEREADEER